MLITADGTATFHLDMRRYNQPTRQEIAGFVPDAQQPEDFRRCISLWRHDNTIHRIHDCNPAYHPLHYPLLFLYGNQYPTCWHPDLKGADGSKVTLLQWASLLLHERAGANESNHFLNAGKLTQEFMVDLFCQFENQRLSWVRHNQSTIRADLYSGVCDAVTTGALADCACMPSHGTWLPIACSPVATSPPIWLPFSFLQGMVMECTLAGLFASCLPHTLAVPAT